MTLCFEIEESEIQIQHNTEPAARKTQMVRQAEKKTHTHDTDSWRQANKEGMCAVGKTNVL